MTSEQIATDPVAEAPQTAPTPKPSSRNRWLLLIAAVVVIDIAALFLFPPFPKDGAPGDACSFPACFIESTLEFPAPTRSSTWRPTPRRRPPTW